MEITVTYEQSRVLVTILHISGAIDSSNYEDLDRIALSSIGSGARYVLLDLSKVRFMSSAALRSFQKIERKLNSLSNGPSDDDVKKGLVAGTYKSPYLKLINPSAPVNLTLKTAGWDMVFEIHKDMKKAIASF